MFLCFLVCEWCFDVFYYVWLCWMFYCVVLCFCCVIMCFIAFYTVCCVFIRGAKNTRGKLFCTAEDFLVALQPRVNEPAHIQLFMYRHIPRTHNNRNTPNTCYIHVSLFLSFVVYSTIKSDLWARGRGKWSLNKSKNVINIYDICVTRNFKMYQQSVKVMDETTSTSCRKPPQIIETPCETHI